MDIYEKPEKNDMNKKHFIWIPYRVYNNVQAMRLHTHESYLGSVGGMWFDDVP